MLFDALLGLEERMVNEGFIEGLAYSGGDGAEERLGRSRGTALGRELGFMRGVALVVVVRAKGGGAEVAAQRLLHLVDAIPLQAPLSEESDELLQAARAQFKLTCSRLGVIRTLVWPAAGERRDESLAF